RDSASKETHLVAYVAQHDATELDVRDGKTNLARTLPDYMVPSAFVVLDAFPRTTSGKVDRKRLPDIEFESTTEYVAPRNPVEASLAEIWIEILGVSRVGVDDNFFELGGHSLLATRVVSRIRLVLGVELPLRALFEAPTIARLATQLSTAQRDAGAPQLVK